MIRKTGIAFVVLALLLFLVSCGKEEKIEDVPPVKTYERITMAEAKEVFETPGEYIIVDVRRPDEYAEGHIPSAVNIPNENIGTVMPEELPDLDAVIYVYCRSGNRSKQAAEKLVNIGYTGVIEFGGILDWTGDTEK